MSACSVGQSGGEHYAFCSQVWDPAILRISPNARHYSTELTQTTAGAVFVEVPCVAKSVMTVVE